MITMATPIIHQGSLLGLGVLSSPQSITLERFSPLNESGAITISVDSAALCISDALFQRARLPADRARRELSFSFKLSVGCHRTGAMLPSNRVICMFGTIQRFLPGDAG
jgi:hypothetical protein